MSKLFTYSLLQYHHSLILNESLNLGIVFHFPNVDENESQLYFVKGNLHRIQKIYSEFDYSLLNTFLKTIEDKIGESNSLFKEQNLNIGLQKFLHKNILAEDDSSLQFTEIIAVNNIFKSPQEAIKSYTKLLLPETQITKTKETRTTESFINKKYLNFIHKAGKEIEEKIQKKPAIQDIDTTIKFDFAWKNGTLNYVKSLSFDLKEPFEIENKGFLNAGQLNFLSQKVDPKKISFHYLIAPPADKKLYKYYEKAIDVIDQSESNHRLVLEKKLKEYSEETIEALRII